MWRVSGRQPGLNREEDRWNGSNTNAVAGLELKPARILGKIRVPEDGPAASSRKTSCFHLEWFPDWAIRTSRGSTETFSPRYYFLLLEVLHAPQHAIWQGGPFCRLRNHPHVETGLVAVRKGRHRHTAIDSWIFRGCDHSHELS